MHRRSRWRLRRRQSPDGFDLDQDDNSDPEEPTPDLDLNCRVVDDAGVTNGGGSGNYPFADMGAYEFQVEARADCPWDISPTTGNDWNVGPDDLSVLLAQWNHSPCNTGPPCTPCPADFNGDCDVGPADLGELLANWGMCETIQCETDFGGSEFAGGGGEQSGSDDADGIDWPEIELTEELADWLMISPLDEIWDWLWSLLEG